MLLIGFAGGLRRSGTVGLDVARDQTKDRLGWVEILDKGMVVMAPTSGAVIPDHSQWYNRARGSSARDDVIVSFAIPT